MNGARLIITHLDDTWTTYIFGETEREHGEIRAQSWHRESNGITVYLSSQVLPLCLNESLAPRGDLLWRSLDVTLQLIHDATVIAYEQFYTPERLLKVLSRLPLNEHEAIKQGYALLASSRAEPLLPAAEWLAC